MVKHINNKKRNTTKQNPLEYCKKPDSFKKTVIFNYN